MEVKFQQAHNIAPATFTWAYELCEQNMRSLYEDVWGWKPAEKQKELRHPDARYLLVYDTDGTTVAYVHFRYACSLLLPLEAVQELLWPSMVAVNLLTLLPNTAKNHHQQST